MKSDVFRLRMLKLVNQWEAEDLSNLEFYKASMSLYKNFKEHWQKNPDRANNESMNVLRLVCLEYYFESLPYNFYGKTHIPYFKHRLQLDYAPSRQEEEELQRKLVIKEPYEQRYARLKSDPFYKPFAELLESIDLKTIKIANPKKFGWALSTAIKWSSGCINHPAGKISWVDTYSFKDISINEPQFFGKGICYAGLTSGGIELNVPFSFELNLETQYINCLWGDFYDNSSEERGKLTGNEKLYFKIDINKEDFFKRLKSNYYDILAKELASQL